MKSSHCFIMRIAIFFIFFLPAIFTQSQTKTSIYDKLVKVNYSHIDTSDIERKAMLKVWKSYLMNRIYGFVTKNDTLGARYWNTNEKLTSTSSDHISSIFQGLFYFQTTILSIDPFEDGYFRILNFGSDIDSAGNLTMKAIYYVLIKKVNGSYKLFNNFYKEKDNLKTTTIGNIQYYYPKYYQFSRKRANALKIFADSLSVLFNVPLQNKIEYVIDTNTNSLINRFGCIYLQTYYTSKGGQYLKAQKMILTNFGENDRHELVHYYTAAEYPNKIQFFDEGLATYLGGSMGFDLKYHTKKLYNYIATLKADTINLRKLPRLDQETDPAYILGALLIKYTVDNFGIQKVFTLLTYSWREYTTEEVIEKEFGIPKSNQDSFFLGLVKKYSN